MDERKSARWLLRVCIILGAIAGAALAGEFVAGIGPAVIALAGLAGGTAGGLLSYSAAYPEYRGICVRSGEGAHTDTTHSPEEISAEASPKPGAHVSRLQEQRSRATHEHRGV